MQVFQFKVLFSAAIDHMTIHKAVFFRVEGFDGKPVPEIDILLVANLIKGLFGAPVQVEVVLLHFRIGGDILLIIHEFVGHLADLSRHKLQIDSHTLVFTDNYSGQIVGMGDADAVGVALDEGFVLRIIENPGVLSQHGLHQRAYAEPLHLTADILKAVELCLLHRSQIHHAVQGIEILRYLPYAQLALWQYFCFQKYSHFISIGVPRKGGAS
jgi:hypothetical protein